MFSFFSSAANDLAGRIEIATPATPAARKPFSSERREVGPINALVILHYLLCIHSFARSVSSPGNLARCKVEAFPCSLDQFVNLSAAHHQRRRNQHCIPGGAHDNATRETVIAAD